MLAKGLEIDGRTLTQREERQDGDGLLASRLAMQLLIGRGACQQSSEVAIGVVDVRGCGVLVARIYKNWSRRLRQVWENGSLV